jgi:anaerobic selenocysteine-containing dehydrogenase
MYSTTETAREADLVLPAAGWGEKEGTFINSERRFGLHKKVSMAPGLALADFHIFQLIAHYWGCEDLFREWRSPEATFQILKRLSAGQPCDITGIRDYKHLDEAGGIQWPWPNWESGERDADIKETEAASQLLRSTNTPSNISPPLAERRLFENGQFYHAGGRAKFWFEAPRPMPEPPSKDYPFLLLTGRGTAVQWHTQTRTEKSAVLRKLAPQSIYVEINPDDARGLGIAPQDWVTVTSQRGEVRARAFVTPTIQSGQVFIPMHYESANQLTDAVFDPYSRQPSYKACAVRVTRA